MDYWSYNIVFFVTPRATIVKIRDTYLPQIWLGPGNMKSGLR